jgi:hypothetical protein
VSLHPENKKTLILYYDFDLTQKFDEKLIRENAGIGRKIKICIMGYYTRMP